MSRNDDLFELVDACDLRWPKKSIEYDHPDLLELYTRRPRRIEPHAPKIDLGFWVFIITFGTIILSSLVMCL